MFNFMTDIRSRQYAVRVETGGETHPRLNQSDRYEIRRGCCSSLRENVPCQPSQKTSGQRVVRGDTGGRSRRSCDRGPQFPLPLSGPVPLSLLTTGRINGPFKGAQGSSNKVCCGWKLSHPEPHSLRPQPINPNIIRNCGIHSRNLLSSRSVRSWRLCLLPWTVDVVLVSDDEVRLLRGCNHHEGCGWNPSEKARKPESWSAITPALLSTELWPSKVHVFMPLWKMDHHSSLWCAHWPFRVMHAVS